MVLQENLDVFMAEFSVACSKGAASFRGILDMPDQTLTMAGVNLLSTDYGLTVKSSDVDAIGIKSGDQLVVNSRPYVVRDVMLQDDGAFTRLTLSR